MSDLQCPATIVVARHAKAEYVERDFSDEGGSLTLEGRAQAAALADLVTDRRIAHVWTSDTSRAVQTAEIVAARLGVGVSAQKSLREIFIGDLLGTAFDLARLDTVCDRWFDGDLDAGFPGGETGRDVVDRYTETFDAIADSSRGETVLVVVHQMAGGISLPSMAVNLRPAYAREHELQNGESVELLFGDGERRVVRWAGAAL